MEHNNQQYQYQQVLPQHAGNDATTEKMSADEMHPGSGYGHGQHGVPQHQQQQYHPQQQYAGADPHAAGHHQYPPSAGAYAATQAPSHPAKGSPKGTICGMKRGLFVALMLLLLLLIGLVIGLGAGLGVSQSNLHAKESELAAAKSSASPTVFVTVSPAATSSGAKPTSTSSHPTGSADKYSCLSNGGTANNTQYTSSAAKSNNKFTVYCGIDFGDQEGAKNLDAVNATSMPDCMDACARARDCQGAGWGTLGEANDDPHMCYMKTNLSKSHGADKGWTFAVLSSVPVTVSSPSN
ncbi:hypothetical protein PG993_005733 [Apiospora rasikravindrae]|uniref:Apple domain-containing protein n=1 Tax=Apiospora rasikravindrae TaxID=990691 RepID=A0ABR1T9M4_9PEZI